MQPVAVLQLSLVQKTPSLQVIAPPAHTLAAHASPEVQALPSSQLAVLATLAHPVKGLQESLLHGLPSLQFSAPVAPQTPPLQTSPVVQTLPSVHGKILAICTQPVLGSQLSFVQTLPSSQLMETLRQLPPLHLSPLVHALPSSQTIELLPFKQIPVATVQLSVVQGLLSLQFFNPPGSQALALQTSPKVQALPSVQGLTLATWVQPLIALQLSSVHTLLSSQLTVAPGKQTPTLQASPTVQTLLSALQPKPSFCEI